MTSLIMRCDFPTVVVCRVALTSALVGCWSSFSCLLNMFSCCRCREVIYEEWMKTFWSSLKPAILVDCWCILHLAIVKSLPSLIFIIPQQSKRMKAKPTTAKLSKVFVDFLKYVLFLIRRSTNSTRSKTREIHSYESRERTKTTTVTKGCDEPTIVVDRSERGKRNEELKKYFFLHFQS